MQKKQMRSYPIRTNNKVTNKRPALSIASSLPGEQRWHFLHFVARIAMAVPVVGVQQTKRLSQTSPHQQPQQQRQQQPFSLFALLAVLGLRGLQCEHAQHASTSGVLYSRNFPDVVVCTLENQTLHCNEV